MLFYAVLSWLGWPLRNICVTNDDGYVPLVGNTSRSFPRSWLITGCVTRWIRRVSLVEQELPTLPEHLSSPPIFSGVRVTRSLVLYVCFVDPSLSFCPFSFGHCAVFSSSIYGFWLPLWYFQTLLLGFTGSYIRTFRYIDDVLSLNNHKFVTIFTTYIPRVSHIQQGLLHILTCI
jgi:hypothetical protein